LKLNKIEHAGHAQNSSQLAALPNSTTEIVKRRFLVTVLSLSPALPLVFLQNTFFGREKGACDRASEASADRSIFLCFHRVNTLLRERNLFLVTSTFFEVQPLFLHYSIGRRTQTSVEYTNKFAPIRQEVNLSC